MAQIGITPVLLKNFEFIVDVDDFAAACPSILFTPSQAISVWKGGTPGAIYTDVSNPTWQCTTKIGQDWETTGSLVNYLFSNQGALKTVKFRPLKKASGTSKQWTAQLYLGAPAIGGDIDSWAETTVTHGVLGAPIPAVV